MKGPHGGREEERQERVGQQTGTVCFCRTAQPEAQALGAMTRKPLVSKASRHPAALPAQGRVQGQNPFCGLPAWHLLSRVAILPGPPVFSELSLSLASDLPEAKLRGELGLD